MANLPLFGFGYVEKSSRKTASTKYKQHFEETQRKIHLDKLRYTEKGNILFARLKS